MFSISEVSKKSEFSARALRHYEEEGLINSIRNQANGYRYYPKSVFEELKKIKSLKEMNFSLKEIKTYLHFENQFNDQLISKKLQLKISQTQKQIDELEKSKVKLENKLLATKKFYLKEDLNSEQRRVFMDTIKNEIIEKLKQKGEVSKDDLEYLKREEYLYNTSDKKKFIDAVKKCLEFAKGNDINLGPARGTAPAFLSLYAIGFSDFDPRSHHLIPERLGANEFDLHIDVEFKNGRKFIDYCKLLSSELPYGKIEAFKLPILDIIENTHKRIGHSLNYDEISNDDPMILDMFRQGDIEKIFSFDIPSDTLVAKHFDEELAIPNKVRDQFSEYLRGQKIIDSVDLINIEAIFRPENIKTKPFFREYIERYPRAKEKRHFYQCLNSSLNERLAPNYGVLIYQEDIIEIIREYTGWDYAKCNQFRLKFSKHEMDSESKEEILRYISLEIYELLEKETECTFCKAHAFGAWNNIIKKTVVLKSLYKKDYYAEIESWEKENGYSWGDFGFISGELSLMQQ